MIELLTEPRGGCVWRSAGKLCNEPSDEWRTDFPEWCFRCCLEEGRADGQPSLSLINKPSAMEWRKCLRSVNKRDAAYAFPHELSSGPSEGHRRCGLDGGRAAAPELPETCSPVSQNVGFSLVCSGQSLQELSKVFIGWKVFCPPGFPLKLVSCWAALI